MASIMAAGAAAALVVVVAVVHRGRGVRTRLLWWAAATLMVHAVLRQVEVVYGELAIVDLFRRLLFLTTQAAVLTLVMTFKRGQPFSRRTYLWVWGLAGVVGMVECVLVALMPTHADGTLYAYTEASRSPFILAYYGLDETITAVTAVACSVGSISLLVRTRQPVVAWVSLVLLTLAAAVTVAYECVLWVALVGPGFSYQGVRHGLYLAAVVLLFAGLAVGGVRRLVVDGRGERRGLVGLSGKTGSTPVC